MKHLICSILFAFFFQSIVAQNIDVDGSVIIRSAAVDSSESTIVVQQSNGTLAVREYESFEKVKVGDIYEGGIVFFTFNDGANGLIMSTEDVASDLPWSPILNNLDTVVAIFDGQFNTAEIVAEFGASSNYAARACDEYSAGGYTDWYLPARGEMVLLMKEFYLLQQLLEQDNDPSTIPLDESSVYWTSTQINSQFAYVGDWRAIDNASKIKNLTDTRTRAIRRF